MVSPNGNEDVKEIKITVKVKKTLSNKPPFWHGSGLQSSILISQNSPLYPGLHSHVKFAIASLHVAWLDMQRRYSKLYM